LNEKKTNDVDEKTYTSELNLRKFPGHYNRQTAYYGAINV